MKNKNFIKKEKGFTLIELIIVCGIVGILAAISFKNLNDVNKGSKNNAACSDAAAIINKGRNYALVGKCAGNGATSIAVNISANGTGTIADNRGNCNESFKVANYGCAAGTWRFSIPSGTMTAGGSVACGTKTLTVDQYKAACP